MASDLIGGTGRRGDDVRSGLSSIVDAAVKRHASSDVVPQVDGALAVLLLMVLRGRSDDPAVIVVGVEARPSPPRIGVEDGDRGRDREGTRNVIPVQPVPNRDREDGRPRKLRPPPDRRSALHGGGGGQEGR